MTIPEGLKPETVWKVLEHEGFQILVQNGYDNEQEERPCVRLSSPMNGVMVSIAVRGGDEAWCQKVFDATDNGERALNALIQQVAPMMGVLLDPPFIDLNDDHAKYGWLAHCVDGEFHWGPTKNSVWTEGGDEPWPATAWEKALFNKLGNYGPNVTSWLGATESVYGAGPTDVLDTDLDYLRNPIPKTER